MTRAADKVIARSKLAGQQSQSSDRQHARGFRSTQVGNAKVAEGGEVDHCRQLWWTGRQAASNFAKIVAHENVEARLVRQRRRFRKPQWPTDTFFTDEFEMYFNGEAIQFVHVRMPTRTVT